MIRVLIADDHEAVRSGLRRLIEARRIAAILEVSLKTVEACRASALQKLHLATSAGLIRYAIRNGIIEP